MNNEIWIIHPNAFTPDMSGPTRAYDLAKELLTDGFNVRVISSSFHYQTYKELKDYGKRKKYLNEEINSVKFTWIKTFPYKSNGYRRFLNWLDLSKKIYTLNKYSTSKPSLIIGSSPNPFAALSSFYLANKLNIPFIFEFRDIWPDTLTEVFGLSSTHPLVLISAWIIKKLYKKSDHIISTLPLGHSKVLEQAPSRNKKDITWIPNGVNTNKFLEPVKTNLTIPKQFKYLKDENKFHVIYAGSLGNAYNLMNLIKAARLLENKISEIHITIIGNGAKKEKMKEYISKYSINNVSFKQPIEKRALPTVLDTADLLYASMKEAAVFRYGVSMNKLQEYLLLGKPVVFACEICGNNPIAISGAGKVANSSDASSISKAIYELYQLNGKERKIMGKKGKEYVLDNFSMDVLGQKLENVINNVI